MGSVLFSLFFFFRFLSSFICSVESNEARSQTYFSCHDSSTSSEILNNTEESSKRVHFENNAASSAASPSTKNRLGLLASLKNTYSSKLEQSPVKSGSGILTKLHEKLAGTRSSPDPGGGGSSSTGFGSLLGSNSTISAGAGGSTGSLANLDVPKLRDLKSHSFPPPFSSEKKETVGVNPQVSINDLTDTSDSTPSQEYVDYSTDDRRKRWQLHTSSTFSFVATG